MVSLANWTPCQPPYNVQAHPYNYSDMTGFNMRVVNPDLAPLKGYWMAIHDSGNAGQLWSKVSWTATNATPADGCSVEVYVHAADERTDLGSAFSHPRSAEYVRARKKRIPIGTVRELEAQINKP